MLAATLSLGFDADSDRATGTTSAFDDSDAEPTAPKNEKVWVPHVGPLPLGRIPHDLVERAAEVRNLPLADRMKAVSDPMLEAPYVADPLGEGDGVDADPLARFDVFDCLTFVEEVLALSLAGDPTHAADVRLDLRYAGPVDYANRKHFMELQWIPGNIARGWLRDSTADYGEPTHLHKEVTAQTWASWAPRRGFAMTDEQMPTGEMRLDVLTIEQALAAVDTIRPGSIILTVREDRANKPIWISHVGFTIPGDRPTVRHATRMGRVPRVRDHSLEWYISHLESYRGWRAIGVSILEPLEQGPRIAAPPSG